MNDMKEFTVVTTMQFTEIIKADDIKLKPNRVFEDALKEYLNLDDCQILKTQVFINDQN